MSLVRNAETGLKERSIDEESILMMGATRNLIARVKDGPDLFGRLEEMTKFVEFQQEKGLWLYNRRMMTGPSTEVLAMDDNGEIIHGINFASADYLGLAQNDRAKEAAISAAREFGVNSAGSPLAFGATKYYMQLREQLAEYWQCPGLIIYSAGWLAGFGVIKGFLSNKDHVIIDRLAHNCLVEGAEATTTHIKRFTHLDQDEMTRLLVQTRKADPDHAILVVTQGLFSMDSDSPDIVYYQRVCKENNAFLLIDCAHDFGHIGQSGRGVWDVQGLKDRSNVILVGTGSKTLSTNIGFVGAQDKKAMECLKYLSSAFMFTNAINPVQAATSLANLRILRSEEGAQLRRKVVENYHYLRGQLNKLGYRVIGNPCAILPLFVGNELVSRIVSRLMLDHGVHVNGIEYPVVKFGQARLRVSLMPQHTKAHLDQFVRVFHFCFKFATNKVEEQLKNLKLMEPNAKL